MAISKKVKLDNGINLTYHTINTIFIRDNSIDIILDSFMSKKYFDLATKRDKLLQEQKQYNTKFNELYLADLSEKEEKELDKLAKKINEIANKIDECDYYNDFVLARQNINVPFMSDFSIKNIEEYLLTLDEFKDSEIIE